MRANLRLMSLAVVPLALAAPARAEGPKVELLPYQPISRQASPELCAQITTAVAGELGGSDAITLVQGADEGAAAGVDESAAAREKAVEEARIAYDKALTRAEAGSKLVKKQKFDPAIKTLTETLELFSKSSAALTDVTPVVQAHVDLAVALWKRGREDEATAELTNAVRLNPDYKPDAKEYWPLFLRVYDQQWRKTLRAGRGSIRVDATVPGAEVFLDGKSVGATPAMLVNAVAGSHYLRVAKDGAGVFGARVEVTADNTVEVTADLGGGGNAGEAGLGPVAHAITANKVDDAAVTAAAALGKKKGAAFVLFGGVSKGETGISVATFMVDVAQGRAARLVDVEMDTDLLSASVESFKIVEEVGTRIKDFGETLPPGANPILRSLAGVEERGPTEIDVGPPLPDAKGDAEVGKRGPVVAEGGEEGGGRAIAGALGEGEEGEGGGRRPRRGGPPRRSDEEYKRKVPIYMNPLVIVPVAVGVGLVGVLGVVLLGGAAAGGGFGAYYFLAPPRTATVEATWPK